MTVELFRMDEHGTVWQEPSLFDAEPAPTLLDEIQAAPPAEVRPVYVRRSEGGTISARTGEVVWVDYLLCPHGCRHEIGDPHRAVVLSKVRHDCESGTWELPDAPAWSRR